jgi:hypothetical protein
VISTNSGPSPKLSGASLEGKAERAGASKAGCTARQADRLQRVSLDAFVQQLNSISPSCEPQVARSRRQPVVSVNEKIWNPMEWLAYLMLASLKGCC